MGTRMKMEKRLGVDLDIISNLPENVTDQILVRLPIRDAVRTSFLSSKWRYKWAVIPELVFHDGCILPALQTDKNKLVKFIDRVLLVHKGPIQKFELSTSRLQSCSSIDCWVLFLSRNGIKEFIFKFWDGERYKLPSCLFSSQEMRSLELLRCVFKPPLTFKGFSKLKSLNLQEITFGNEAFDSLISNCPLLERLTLKHFDGPTHLRICAANLRYFCLFGKFKDICFEDTPLLSVVSIGLGLNDDEHFEQSETCNLVKVFSSLPRIRKFVVKDFFLEFLALGNVPERLPTTYGHLNTLSLPLNFEDSNEILVIICLFNSSPNLRELEIWACSDMDEATIIVEDFWEAQGHPDCNMYRLRMVKMINMSGVLSELKFIKFLLANSPILEMLSIKPYSELDLQEPELLKLLLRFPRASAKAEIEYLEADQYDKE